MYDKNTAQFIEQNIRLVRRLLSRCAETLDNFNSDIVRILQLGCIGDYSSIIDCFYLFEDTELAKDHIRREGLATMSDQANFGLVYLKFYGLMNACYLQQQGIIVCAERLQLKIDLKAVKENELIQFRNDFGAHSPNRGRRSSEHSFILDRFGLLEGRVSGYSSNSPSGLSFRNGRLDYLLSEWDEVFYQVLNSVSIHISEKIHAAGIQEI